MSAQAILKALPSPHFQLTAPFVIGVHVRTSGDPNSNDPSRLGSRASMSAAELTVPFRFPRHLVVDISAVCRESLPKVPRRAEFYMDRF